MRIQRSPFGRQRSDRRGIAGLVVAAALALGGTRAPAAVRDYGGRYTAERIANLRSNCARYDWAKAQQRAAVAAAKPWVEQSDEVLWAMIPGQKLPRCIDVTYYKGKRAGCLQCGTAIHRFGNYPYRADIWGSPFKLTCPNCKVVFPTNDFRKYYQSGIDETGVFDPAKADRRLLFNAEHPHPNDPLHKYGVDDGYGYFDEQGGRHLFVAYFVWQYWNEILGGVTSLANAYLFTGEQRYAHKALVLLDRIADVYPDYDWAPYARLGYYHSDGGTGRGKIEGCIWECGTVEKLATAIDMVLSGTRDDPELYSFLAGRAAKFKLPRPKGTRELLVQNLDDRILREGAKAVYNGQCAGNEGMNQTTLAACAIALDTQPDTEKWLDYLFDPQGEHIPSVIVGGIDRDGVGAEGAPGYALSWGTNLGQCADLLADYGKYTTHDIYRDFPQFKATFLAGWRMAVLGYATPNTGDSGATGSVGVVAAVADFIVRGYKYLRDPRIGLAAYHANGKRAVGLGRDILSADPDRISRDIAQLASTAEGNPFAGGHNLAGYGLASLAFGWGKPGTAIYVYYGRNWMHGHLDRLNIDILYRGLWMMPDHGYPEYTSAWPHRMYVTRNTISHNTVVVNQLPQKTNWAGQPELFCQQDDFGAVRVDSREMYDGLQKYQRTVAFIKLGEGHAYAFDVFRVQGGNDHLYSLHGPPGPVTCLGLNLVPQQGGSYAGPGVEYRTQTPAGARYGYAWIANVERDTQPPAAFIVDWKAQAGYRGVTDRDDVHLRYHGFNELADVALGDMEPPQNKQGNPRWLRYLLAHRAGQDLASTFVGLLEPYQGRPAIQAAERLEVVAAPEGACPAAIKVTLADGTIDYLMASDHDTGLVKTESGPEFAGAMAWLRVKAGVVERAALCRGTRVALGKFALTAPAPGYTGKVVKMSKGLAEKGYVWVDAALPAGEALKGQSMLIDNDRVRNACYQIESVEQDGGLAKVCLGDVCFVRGFVDPREYAKGYTYDFAEGAALFIPASISVRRTGPGNYAVEAAADAHVQGP